MSAMTVDYTPIGIRDPADVLVAFGYQQLRFEGSVTVARVSGETVVTIGAGGSIIVQENGVTESTSGTLNFVGSNVSVTDVGGVATVSITSAPIDFEKDGTLIVSGTTLNFTGSNITVSDVGGVATVSVSNAPITGTAFNVAVFDNAGSLADSSDDMVWNLNSRVLEIRNGGGVAANTLNTPIGLIIGEQNNFSSSSGTGANVIIGAENICDYQNTIFWGSLIVGQQNNLSKNSSQIPDSIPFIIGNTNNLVSTSPSESSFIFGDSNTFGGWTQFSSNFCLGTGNSLSSDGSVLNCQDSFIIGFSNSFDSTGSTALRADNFIIGASNSCRTNSNVSRCYIIGTNNFLDGDNVSTYVLGSGNTLFSNSSVSQTIIGFALNFSPGVYQSNASVILNAINTYSLPALAIQSNNNSVAVDTLDYMQNAAVISIPSPGTFIIHADHATYIQLTADNSTSNSATAITNGLNVGQLLMIEVIGPSGSTMTIKNGANTLNTASADVTLTIGSIITYIWNGTFWNQVSQCIK